MYFNFEMILRMKGCDEAVGIPLVAIADGEATADEVMESFHQHIDSVFRLTRKQSMVVTFPHAAEANGVGLHPEAGKQIGAMAFDFAEVAAYQISRFKDVQNESQFEEAA